MGSPRWIVHKEVVYAPDLQLRPGRYVKFKGSWAYLVSVRDDGRVVVSGWRGIKSAAGTVDDVTHVGDRAQAGEHGRR